MKKSTLFYLLIIPAFISHVFAQEVLFEKQLPTDFKVKSTYQITNLSDYEMSLFFADNKKMLATLVNSNLEEVGSFEASTFPKEYNIPFGAQKKGNNLFIFYLTNRSKDEFGVVEVDFNSNSTKSEPLDLKFKKETFLQAFDHNGKVHILSIQDKSSILNFYVFDDQGGYSKKTLDLTHEKFRYWDNSLVDIYTLMSQPFGGKVEELLVKIDASTPNSLETSAAASKLFLEKDAFYLTFESNRSYSQVIQIDPEDFGYGITTFNKPYIANAPAWKKSNSFIYKGHYLGVTATNNILKFEIKDYNSRDVLQTYTIEKNKDIDFKNTPIGVDGSLYGNNLREIENENRFLRDVSDDEIGVSIYPANENHIVSLGSFKKVKIPIIGYAFPITEIGFLNVTGFAYFNVTNSHSTYFKSIFNQNFEHQKGNVPQNSFDKISSYLENNKDIDSKDVFKSREETILGYITDENVYKMVTF